MFVPSEIQCIENLICEESALLLNKITTGGLSFLYDNSNTNVKTL